MNLTEIVLRFASKCERERFDQLIETHHYLGARQPAGETLYDIATWRNHWVALLSFSAAALKCSVRDQWIGWYYRHQFDRLPLIANNSRFLILPEWHVPNLATRVLSLCQRRIQTDWQDHFKHPLLLLETFVDPSRFHGTCYRATNWHCLGYTKGFRRAAGPAYTHHAQPKWMFVYPLQRNARQLLAASILPTDYQCGKPNMMLTAEQMCALPDCFKSLTDPRRMQGRRHRLSTVLSIAMGAILCGRIGYKAIAEWAQSLQQKARERFDCYYNQGQYHVPSVYVIRDLLTRIDPQELTDAITQWNRLYAQDDESLAIDGKTLCNAVDEDGRQTHIMSAIGHQSLSCHAQKKLENCQ